MPDIQMELRRCLSATLAWKKWYGRCTEYRDRGLIPQSRAALEQAEKYAAVLAEIDERWSYRDPHKH